MDKDKQVLLKQAPHNLNELYNKYAGMLYGYIFEIVKDEGLAGRHLVAIYSSMPAHINMLCADGENVWRQLRQLALKQLSVLDDSLTGDKEIISGTKTYDTPNKFTGLMTDVQKRVFCSIYYNTSSIARISEELHISENCVRKILKEAIDIIKKR